jgi:hypothetical protein
MKSTNRSWTPILALVISVLVIALTVFVLAQRGGEVDGGYGTVAYPEVDAPERTTDSEALETATPEPDTLDTSAPDTAIPLTDEVEEQE